MLVYQRVPVFDTSILSLIKPHSTAAEASAPGTAPSSDLEVAAGGTGDSPADRSWCYEWLLMVINGYPIDILVYGWPTPRKNDGVRQWWLFFIYHGRIKTRSKPPISNVICKIEATYQQIRKVANMEIMPSKQ